MTFDLGVEGGTVVTSRGRRPAHVYVEAGRIAAVSSERQPAGRTVDASGLLVMPGMVDVHVHLMDPSATDREDFPTGSAAAARAGVTTIVEHAHSGPVRTPEDLRRKAAYLATRSHVDFALAAHAWPGMQDQVAPLWQSGAAFMKAFTCTTHGVPGHDPAQLRELLERVREAGAVCLVHAEDESLTAEAERRLRGAERQDGGVIPAWRNRDAELVAVGVATLLARRTGARTVIAHASHPDIVDLVARERRRGADVRVECCPQYLTLLEDEVETEGAFRKFTPPARARGEQELSAMWRALAGGRIDYISSDHAPSTREQKTSGSIWDVHFGLPGIDTTFAILLDGAAHGLLSYERVVEVYAEAPARIFGLRGKGRLAPGADGDLVLVDPHQEWTVRDGDVVSRAAWSPFSGRTLRGRPVASFLRGVPLLRDGEVVGALGAGRFLAGAGAGAEVRAALDASG